MAGDDEKQEERDTSKKEKWFVVFLREITTIDPSTSGHYRVGYQVTSGRDGISTIKIRSERFWLKLFIIVLCHVDCLS